MMTIFENKEEKIGSRRRLRGNQFNENNRQLPPLLAKIGGVTLEVIICL